MTCYFYFLVHVIYCFYLTKINLFHSIPYPTKFMINKEKNVSQRWFVKCHALKYLSSRMAFSSVLWVILKISFSITHRSHGGDTSLVKFPNFEKMSVVLFFLVTPWMLRIMLYIQTDKYTECVHNSLSWCHNFVMRISALLNPWNHSIFT